MTVRTIANAPATSAGVVGGHQAELFHVDEDTAEYPIARPLPLATRGRTEYGVRCPKCRQMHRHVHLGLVDRAPCGAKYYVQPKRRPTRRAA